MKFCVPQLKIQPVVKCRQWLGLSWEKGANQLQFIVNFVRLTKMSHRGRAECLLLTMNGEVADRAFSAYKLFAIINGKLRETRRSTVTCLLFQFSHISLTFLHYGATQKAASVWWVPKIMSYVRVKQSKGSSVNVSWKMVTPLYMGMKLGYNSLTVRQKTLYRFQTHKYSQKTKELFTNVSIKIMTIIFGTLSLWFYWISSNVVQQ